MGKILIILSLLVMTSYSVSAQTSTGPTPTVIETISTEPVKPSEARKDTEKKGRNDKVIKIYQKLIKRLKMMNERLIKIGERLGKRLDKLEAKGEDVTDLRNILTGVQSTLTNTSTLIKVLEAKEKDLSNIDDISVFIENTKNSVEIIKNNFKSVYTNLNQIVNGIKELIKEEGNVTPKPTEVSE